MLKPSDYGLNDQEYQKILDELKREPNTVEMNIFSAMWSEHCSYKHTRSLFSQFPTQAEWVVTGPGENAGVVSINKDWAVVFKVESHNHPSFIVPYDGACTGVGGLLRDVMAMGARPVGVKALLRTGDLDSESTRTMLDSIRKGAEDYAAGCGVAFLGTELITHPCYAKNPLVNVLVIGLARKDALARSGAGAVGNLLVYFGRPTGTEGVYGAAFASKGMDDTTEAHPPAGDPLAGNELMLATLELIEQGLIVGIQDMGAAGLTCSSFEMAQQEGHGFTLDLDQVPVDQPGLPPEVLLLSETQERMLASVQPAKLDAVLAVLAHYSRLTAAVIGKVEKEPIAILTSNGKECARLSPDLVVDGYPRYSLLDKPVIGQSDNRPMNTIESSNQVLDLAMIRGNETLASELTVESSVLAGGKCAYISLGKDGSQVLLSTRCNGSEIIGSPYQTAFNLVMEACNDLQLEGARPLALTDGLNFGNPDRPEIAFQISESIRGLANACKKMGIPVIGGNVSLYNESSGQPIIGQVFIGVVGVKE